MNSKAIKCICLLALLVPAIATAQKNIQSAFDAILKNNDAEITRSIKLEKDPDTNIKIGQCSAYDFVLPAKKMNLVKDVLAAIDKDSEQAYGINQGLSETGKPKIAIAVGDGSAPGYHINKPGYEYSYALFLAPKAEDPEGKYRYAYGINYRKHSDRIEGTLLITYATTLKYRQQQDQERQNRFLNFSSGSSSTAKSNYWFEKVMSYFQGMSTESNKTRILARATKAYSLIQNAEHYDVSEQDKETVREVLKAMISDRKYSDPVLNRLLTQSLASLK